MAAPTATIAVREKIIAQAISQLGVSEDPAYSNNTPYTRWYGIKGPWCAMFVSWCLYMAGFPLKISTSKGFAYCPSGVEWFKSRGAWAGPNVKPKRGWIVFYDFIGRPSHVGIVEGNATDGRVVALEGNTNAAGSRTGGSVMRHHRRISTGIIGYGVINYTGSENEGDFVMDAESQKQMRALLEEFNDKQNVELVGAIQNVVDNAVESIKAHAGTIRNGLRALIRKLPGAPQD